MAQVQQPFQSLNPSTFIHRHLEELNQQHFENHINTMVTSSCYMQQDPHSVYTSDHQPTWNTLQRSAVHQHFQLQQVSQCDIQSLTALQDTLATVNDLYPLNTDIAASSNTQLKSKCYSQATASSSPNVEFVAEPTGTETIQNTTETHSSQVGFFGD